uniref:Uncharacterized protein n=1 Tax=Physcomitrium patens TaxID=3218 RepID=A0A2K1L0X4_PHYPA|nr:hypothetical protein PHYPA_002469 [Physcomitrium patens]
MAKVGFVIASIGSIGAQVAVGVGGVRVFDGPHRGLHCLPACLPAPPYNLSRTRLTCFKLRLLQENLVTERSGANTALPLPSIQRGRLRIPSNRLTLLTMDFVL